MNPLLLLLLIRIRIAVSRNKELRALGLTPFGHSTPNRKRAERLKHRRFCNPKGIVSGMNPRHR